MRPELEPSKYSPPLNISVAKFAANDLVFCNPYDDHFTTPNFYEQDSNIEHGIRLLENLNIKETKFSKNINNRWEQIAIRIPYEPNLLLSITEQWEQGNDVFLTIPTNHKNLSHKVMLNGIFREINTSQESENFSFLLLRFSFNPSINQPKNYIFPC